MGLLQSITESTQTVVFVTIALVAFTFILVTSLFGGDHGDGGHEPSGATELGDNYPTVSFFSVRVLSIFFLAFGAAGTITSAYGQPLLICLGSGFVTGLGTGSIAYLFLRLLNSQQSNSFVQNTAVVGATGKVVTRIPANGVGEVSFVARGQTDTRLARSHNGQELPAGAEVTILSISGDAMLVKPN